MSLRKHFGRVAFCILAMGALVVIPAETRHAIPVFATVATEDPCCGVITGQGKELATILDSMNVEKLWLAREHVDWRTGEADRPPNYMGPGRSSHCSAFAAAVAERLGIYMLHPPDHSEILLASAQAEWFHSHGGDTAGWKQISDSDAELTAQRLANQGNLVVIVYESPDLHRPGHIVIVRPSEKSLADLHKEGPQTVQASMENYNSTIAAKAFKYHAGAWPNGVRYYWHAVDWSKVKSLAAHQ